MTIYVRPNGDDENDGSENAPVNAFASANRTSSDFTRLTLKQGPAPAMWGAAARFQKRRVR
jgi:hypothetical protein